MKLTKKFRTAIFFLVTLLLINGLFPMAQQIQASTGKKTAISAKKLTLVYGKSKALTLKNPSKKVAWFSSNKKIAYADGKKVYGKAVGNATITAKCNGKSYVCKVKVTSGETKKY